MSNTPKTKAKRTGRSSLESHNYVRDFQDMPFLLKILFIFSLYSLFVALLSFMQLKPVSFEYFNSGFPKNYIFIWYLYTVSMSLFGVVVFLKRSYSVLKKYMYLSTVILTLYIFNSIYLVTNMLPNQRMAATLVYVITYMFAILILVYILNQKKYFNKK